MSYPGSRFPLVIGSTIGGSSTTSVTQALNASATWVAYGFQQGSAKTITNVRAFLSATSGTMIAADVTASLYNDSGGSPGTLIDGPVSCAATPSGSAWYNWTGLNTALTGGVQYWIVFKNVNGTPASNFPTFRCIAPSQGFSLASGTSTSGDIKRTSTDSGSTWAAATNSAALGFRIGYSDTTYAGVPVSLFGAGVVGIGIYSARELGSMFTTPAVGVNAIGVFGLINGKTGTPTGNFRFRVYTGSTPSLLATTDEVPNVSVYTTSSPALVWARFASTQTISASTVVRVVGAESTQADASGNRYNMNTFTVDTDAPSLALMPQGGFVQTYFDGSTWTETSSAFVPVGLWLDPGNEFVTGGSSGALLYNPGMSGGMAG